jgi:hypothetical protein
VKDLRGRRIPARYLAGLSDLQGQRIAELTASRDAPFPIDLPTDRIARQRGLVRRSAYTEIATARGIEFRGDPEEASDRMLRYYGGRGDVSDAIAAAYRKGIGAWRSGHRPGVSAVEWGVARVNSLVVGGKTAWTADRKQFAAFPLGVQRRIVEELPEVLDALLDQGRTADVEFLIEHIAGDERG